MSLSNRQESELHERVRHEFEMFTEENKALKQKLSICVEELEEAKRIMTSLSTCVSSSIFHIEEALSKIGMEEKKP